MAKLFTVEDVAAQLHIHVRTARLWLRTGKLRGVKTGKYWRVREEDLEAFIRTHLRPGPETVQEHHEGSVGRR